MNAIRLITYSFILISLAFIIRIIGFIITGNAALALESVHILIDFIITIFILITLKIISSQYSGRYPYGLFKLEDLISLALAVLVAFTGTELLIDGFQSRSSMNLIPSLIQGISVVPILFAGRMKVKAGEILRSPSLKSDGRHTYTDFYEGIGVSAGLFISFYLGSIFYYISISLAFLALILTAYSIGKDSVLSLLDLPKDRSLRERIANIASSVKGVRTVREVRMRWAGPVIFVELVVEMDPLITVDDAHPITEEIERNVKASIDGIYSVSVHVEPVKRKRFRLIIPSEGKEIDSRMDERLAKSDYFAIVDIGESISYKFIENPFREKEDLAGLDFKDFLLDNGITDIICYNVGEITYGLMVSHGIYCWHSDIDTIGNVVNKFLKGNLNKLVHPTRRSKVK
ncbi:MAG: cation diffusion facilitator family transporter [Thermoplasmata archaeon]